MSILTQYLAWETIKTMPETEIYHRRLQAQAYLGIAQVISNHAYSYHDDWAQRHMVFNICHMRAQTYV